MANFDVNDIVNEGMEIMVEDAVVDGGKVGVGAAILIGAGAAVAVGVTVKLVKKGIEVIKVLKERRKAAQEDCDTANEDA